MNQPGRNDLCPCGSGKKFKKCCLAKSEPAGAYATHERQSALAALGRFGWRQEFDGERRIAEQKFWGGCLEGLPQEETGRLVKESAAFFQDWFTCDFALGSGRTLLDLFLEREASRLRSGELRYLERTRLSHLRPYEIVGVRLDEGLDLLDLWAGQRIRVQERLATRQVVQWDVLAARVMLGPSGVPVIDGAPYLYPARAKGQILGSLRRMHRDFRRATPAADLIAFFKRFGRVYFLFWLEHVALRTVPRVVTAEGDEMILAQVVFELRDATALNAVLASHSDLEAQDDGSYAWFESGSEEFRRGLGTFVPAGRRIVFETTSKPRAERGRKFLEALVGDAVRYMATSYESVDQALKRMPPASEDERSAVSPEVEAEVVGAYYERHYRKWVDEPLPALSGKAPREAAQTGAGRAKLVELLKDMESMSARARLRGQPAYDFAWMWAELGLERPG